MFGGVFLPLVFEVVGVPLSVELTKARIGSVHGKFNHGSCWRFQTAFIQLSQQTVIQHKKAVILNSTPFDLLSLCLGSHRWFILSLN
uniref:Uncharacterized protein n=1 Tax=Noccaea caerulescens TaxID=107243 RepID=A0A1J3DRM7_NOCCA